MGKLRLPRLISDGMILQYDKTPHVWGWDAPNRNIIINFNNNKYETVTDEDGRWDLYLSQIKPGGPYEMIISDNAGEEVRVNNILSGNVWMCSGQSNIDVPMDRVKDNYPEEILNCENNSIRIYKVDEHGEFHSPLTELESGSWKSPSRETILPLSATAYFFAKSFNKMTGIPVGVITASLGGTGIETWMSREMLEGYDDLLAVADKYADDDFRNLQVKKNGEQADKWYGGIGNNDLGFKEEWNKEDIDIKDWETINMPVWFHDTALKGFIGCVWFRKTIQVPVEMAGKQSKLWLGTIVDSDDAYVNGTRVGGTGYQYPPRKYNIPEGLLKEGENTIVLRVIVNNGTGRFTFGKKHALFNESGEINLDGEWMYRIAVECGPVPENDFINWKPTVLYNGMMAPCHNYTIKGILWYQGEANIHKPNTYCDLMKRMINGYRTCWNDDKLPFYYVQLPNLDIDLDEVGEGLPALREQQRKVLTVENTGMATIIDLGEDNDWHPMRKEGVGYRLALIAYSNLYDSTVECKGPEVESYKYAEGKMILVCSHAEGMYADSETKGKVIKDFEIIDNSNVISHVEAEIEEEKIILDISKIVGSVKIVRYCYANTNSGALVYNETGLPMSPFILETS